MNLRTWQSRHGFTYTTAAQALGVSRATYARYLKRAELPKLVLLAMERIDEQKVTVWGHKINRKDRPSHTREGAPAVFVDLPIPYGELNCKLSCQDLLNDMNDEQKGMK